MKRGERTQREREMLVLAFLASDLNVELGQRLWAVWMLGEMVGAPMGSARSLLGAINT